jgi:hypothetical protein
VADAGDHRNQTGGDSADDDFGVEAVQVLPRPPAARDNDDVGPLRMGGEPADAGRDLGGAVGALHGCGVNQQVHRGMAAAADLHDVAQRSALQAGNDADAAREGRQRALVLEQAFAAQPGFELLHGSQQSAQPGLLHGLGDELKLSARVVDRKLSAQANGVAVFGPESQQLRLAAEEHDRELGRAVLEREVAVAAGCGPPVGNFAFHRDLAVAALNQRAKCADKLADREDPGGGGWFRRQGDGFRSGCGSGFA